MTLINLMQLGRVANKGLEQDHNFKIYAQDPSRSHIGDTTLLKQYFQELQWPARATSDGSKWWLQMMAASEDVMLNHSK